MLKRDVAILVGFVLVLLLLVVPAMAMAAEGTVECASNIRRVGDSPDPMGNKLQARFTSPFVAKVRVKNTAETSNIRGESGMWISDSKYTGLTLTLILLDANNSGLKECNYNSEGKLVVSDGSIDFRV